MSIIIKNKLNKLIQNYRDELEERRCCFLTHPRFIVIFIVLTLLTVTSCRKLVEIDEPASSLISSKVFSSDATAQQAMAGVYYTMVNSFDPNLCTGGMTIYSGLSSDEFALYDVTNTTILEFYQNDINTSNSVLTRQLWNAPFYNIYSINAVIEGLQNSLSVSDSVKNELLAEAKFTRAFINFYLINLFGPIPYLTSTDWRKNSPLFRDEVSKIYELIISDLKDAKAVLPNDYSVGKGARIVPNRYAASAMLARIYLYLKDWGNAEREADEIINSTLYELEPALNNVFMPNSKEAIWQMQQDNTTYNLNATTEGWTVIPVIISDFGLPPFIYLTDHLLNSFEPNDNRKASWIIEDNVFGAGTLYYCPYKYKTGRFDATSGGTYKEYYMAIRLAEIYLIRAESRAMQDKLNEAITDINKIRQRAGLSPLSDLLTKNEVIAAIRQERKIEFFGEWGHRWLDLKRWNESDATLSLIKPNWQATDTLYPIPHSELLTAPNLTQNKGY